MTRKKMPVHIALMAFTLIILAACAGKKEDTHEHIADQAEWKAMDDFHMIMAETFHPYKDSANLEPVKMRAMELMEAANQWVAAPLPDKVDNETVKSALQKLRSEAIALAESVKVADDTLIAGQLTLLHDTFHELQEAWYE